MTDVFQTGLDRFLAEPPDAMRKGARLGLLMNQASVDRDLQYACNAVAQRFPGQLTAIFSPQHGIWGEQQANMIESGHVRHPQLDVPVYSLYSETRRPTAEMLDQIDCLLIDLQDVGTRVYTFIWTMLECLLACAEMDKAVVILDRPNPIGGQVVEGPMLCEGYQSFVGNAPIPLRHALTMAELTRLLVAEFEIRVKLQVVPVTGWRRHQMFNELGRPWIWPSPNMPTFTTTIVYPGQVLLEGTQLSEGRGTTRPFEVAGAPFLDPHRLLQELGRYDHPGLCLRPLRFCPTFEKWAGASCGGIDLQVIDPGQVRSVSTTIALLAAAVRLAPDDFRWLPPPYEYEYEKPPIDILFGSPMLRERIEAVRQGDHLSGADIAALVDMDHHGWQSRIAPHLIYD